jgi:hypothetical protein
MRLGGIEVIATAATTGRSISITVTGCTAGTPTISVQGPISPDYDAFPTSGNPSASEPMPGETAGSYSATSAPTSDGWYRVKVDCSGEVEEAFVQVPATSRTPR